MKLNWRKKPIWLKIMVIIFCFLLLSEIVLRYIFDLGDYPIYREDADYEYIYKSNQDVWRYGNHIQTNEYGMRSKRINKKKKITILEFGDSVLNGGSHVDQDELATTLEENSLNKKFNDNVQVLNVSAQSWGLSNAYAFLKKHGDFNANILVLVFSSHDLYDNMHFRKVVGVEPAWPEEKPLLAITDAWSRFVWPWIKRIFTNYHDYDYLKGFDDHKVNIGWDNFFSYAAKNNIKIIVYLHASLNEVNAGTYDERGVGILQKCKANGIEVITDLKLLIKNKAAFLDDIHLNEKGHFIMAKLVTPVLENRISDLE